MVWTLRTDKELRWAVFKPYEWHLLNYFIEMKDEVISTKQAHEYLVAAKKLQISRASVIFKLTAWAKDGLLTTTDASGKGGIRKDYVMVKDRDECYQHITQRFLDSINNAFKGVITARLTKSK